jgi:hypothetical protein
MNYTSLLHGRAEQSFDQLKENTETDHKLTFRNLLSFNLLKPSGNFTYDQD